MTMTLVETITLNSDASQIEFTNIPQTATDLMLLVSSRAANINGKITFNNETSAQYNYINLYGDGANPASGAGTNETFLQAFPLHEPRDFNGTNNTTGLVSNGRIYIANYANSQFKAISIDSIMEFNSTESYLGIVSGLWANTSAISSIKIQTTSGNVLTLSSISLYTINKS